MTKYQLSPDPAIIAQARSILAAPEFMGGDAWDATDAEIAHFAEMEMGTFTGLRASISVAARALGSEVRRTMLGRLDKALGFNVRDSTPHEQLIELATTGTAGESLPADQGE